MLSKITTLFLKIFTLPFWYIQKILPRDKKLWVFGAWAGHGYADNAKSVYEYILVNENKIKAIWITRNKNVFNKLKSIGYPVAMANSFKGFYYCLKAGVVFINNHPKDLNTLAINGAIQIWLWHGLMMKQIGQDARKFCADTNGVKIKLKQILQQLFYPELSYNPNFVINTSDFFTPYFCSAFKLNPTDVLITGYPRNDVLFTNTTERLIKELDEKFHHPIKIMYMPTWRDALYKENKPFNPFKSNDFSLSEFLRVLNEKNAVFLNKSHNFEKKIKYSNMTERFINLNNDQFTDLYLLIKDIDILITDYSSVYFDFLLTGKPIILAPFDYDTYITKSRPLYYDYYKEIEGIKVKNWSELIDVIKNEKYFNPSQQTISKFHTYQDNKSSQRVVEKVKRIVNVK